MWRVYVQEWGTTPKPGETFDSYNVAIIRAHALENWYTKAWVVRV